MELIPLNAGFTAPKAGSISHIQPLLPYGIVPPASPLYHIPH